MTETVSVYRDGVEILLPVEDVFPTLPPPTFSELQAAKLAAVNDRVAVELDAGAPVEVAPEVVLHVALDDGSRADLTAMGTTALAAASSAIPWPESYQQGWITKENVRIPLATPQEALGLAAMVGDRYAQIRQQGRDLKDLVLAAEDEEDLDAIDITQGWPT